MATLPDRLDLAQLRRQAKELHRAAARGDADALRYLAGIPEASWWIADPTGRPVDYAGERFFADADPVDAVKEMRDAGKLAWTPRTQLVSEVTKDLYKLPGNG